MTENKQDKYKTSIAFYKDNWVRLQNIAAMQNTSPTAIVNELVEAYVNDKLPDNYEQRIEEKVYATLDTKISNATIKAIAERVAVLLQLSQNGSKTTNATNATNEDNDENLIDVVNEAIFTGGASLKRNKATKATKTTKTTKATKATNKNKAEANVAKFRRYKASDNRKGYDDGYVAAKEGLTKAVVSRYRKGGRSPKAEFIERWGLNWNGEQWIENKENA